MVNIKLKRTIHKSKILFETTVVKNKVYHAKSIYSHPPSKNIYIGGSGLGARHQITTRLKLDVSYFIGLVYLFHESVCHILVQHDIVFRQCFHHDFR